MKKELAQDWVNALRSGGYKQGQEALCVMEEDSPTFCCLGVLCDILADEGVGQWLEPEEGYLEGKETVPFRLGDENWVGGPGPLVDMYVMGIDTTEYLEAETFEKKISLRGRFYDQCGDNLYSIGYAGKGPAAYSLPALNDDLNYTFAQIADLIEERYLTNEETE